MLDPKIILVPTDFSEYGDAAVEYAVDLALCFDATLHLLHVVTMPVPGVGDMGIINANAIAQIAQRDAQAVLGSLADRLRDRVRLGPIRVELGDAREIIDRVAEQIGAGMIVMGTHGRHGLSRWLLGSLAESVVRTAPCPVLTVRRSAA